jgi:hypothetical protein
MGMGKLLIASLLLLLAALAQSHMLNVTVEDNSGTKLVATKVEALQGPTVVASAIADEHGSAYLALDTGSYFIRLVRSGYPDHVLLTYVKDDAQLQAVMSNKRETGILYGRVQDSESSYDGLKIYLLSGWKIISTSTIASGGYYIFPYIFPDDYSIRLDDGSKNLSTENVTISGKEAKYLDISVVHANVTPTPVLVPVLSAPKTATVGSLIVATVRAGTVPYAGVNVSVSTPDGTVVALTDSAGQIAVNAVKGGRYVFSWNGQEAMTEIPVPPALEENVTPQAVQNNTTLEQNATAQPQAKKSEWGILPLAGVGFLLFALLAGAALAGLFAYRKIMPSSRIGPEPEAKKDLHRKKR